MKNFKRAAGSERLLKNMQVDTDLTLPTLPDAHQAVEVEQVNEEEKKVKVKVKKKSISKTREGISQMAFRTGKNVTSQINFAANVHGITINSFFLISALALNELRKDEIYQANLDFLAFNEGSKGDNPGRNLWIPDAFTESCIVPLSSYFSYNKSRTLNVAGLWLANKAHEERTEIINEAFKEVFNRKLDIVAPAYTPR